MIPYFVFTSFSLGSLTFQTWGTLVALGFGLGLLIARQEARRKNLNVQQLLELTVWMMAAALFFSRLFYVFFGGEGATFLAQPWQFFAFWQGGMSSIGGFFGAGLVLIWFWHRQRLPPPIRGGRGGHFFWPYLASLAYAFPFGWLIGRLGCFLIHDHPGRLTNSFFGVNFPQGARFDMALLEILALLPLAVIFIFLSQQENRRGKRFFAPTFPVWLLLWYGTTRFFLDFWRAADLPLSDPRFWGLTLGQWGGIGLVLIGLYLSFKTKFVNSYLIRNS